MKSYRIAIKSAALVLKSAHVEIGASIEHNSFEECVAWAHTAVALEGTYNVTVVCDGVVHKDSFTKRVL